MPVIPDNILDRLEKQRDQFQTLLDHFSETSKNTKLLIITQQHEWMRSIASISVTIGAAIAPILFSITNDHKDWSSTFLGLGIVLLIFNGSAIFYWQKTKIEDDMNQIPWVGLDEQLSLKKLRSSLNQILWYKDTSLLEDHDKLEQKIQQHDSRLLQAINNKTPRINFATDLAMAGLIIGSFFIFARIWPLGEYNYVITLLLVIDMLVIVTLFSTKSAQLHAKKTKDKLDAINTIDKKYMEWWAKAKKDNKTPPVKY